MVLARKCLMVGALAAGVLLSSCAAKHGDAVLAASPMSVAVLVVADYPDREEVTGVPAGIGEALQTELVARNLHPTLLDPADYTEEFASLRTPLHRLRYLAEQNRGSDLVLLVQTEPRYFSLLSGRYRWTVDADLALAPANDPANAVMRHTRIPVFLEFHHEREEEALQAAGPMVERQLRRLLDEGLGGF